MPTQPSLRVLLDLGFKAAGSYHAARFSIDEVWRGKEVVYAWIDPGRPSAPVLRFGIACGHKGFGSRYDHYNRWLDGQFKAEDATEQRKRALFLERLPAGLQVFAIPIADKRSALSLESALRNQWGASLDLDLMAKGSWAKMEMASWRQLKLRTVAPSVTARAVSPVASSLLTRTPGVAFKVSSMVRALFGRLDQGLVNLGLTPQVLARDGVSYRLGAATPVRIDPKADFLRIRVGEDNEAAAPTALRESYTQKGWLIARPRDADLAVDYVHGCAREWLASRR